MIFNIKQTASGDLEEFYEKAMAELIDFFGIKWIYNRPKVMLIDDRKTINGVYGKETEDWFVGWSNGNDIYLLSKTNYEAESSHKYSVEEYKSLLKHELVHCFTYVFSRGSWKPKWLTEGIAIYLSGQNKFKIKPEKFENFIEFFEKDGRGVYRESGFIVEMLHDKYGKEKLLELIKKSKKLTEGEFNELFEKIYGFKLEYKNFNSLIQ